MAEQASGTAGAGRLVDLSTDGIAPDERLAFWRSTVLKRNEPVIASGGIFQARLRRIVLEGAELIEHASEAVVARRAVGRTRFDGGDDIAVELMRDGERAELDHNGEHRLQPGDLYIVDYARPVQIARSRHRASGIVLSRRRVVEILGEDLSGLAGRRIAAVGLAAVLRQHMKATIDTAADMTPAERVLAVQGAAEMALAVLQADRVRIDDAQQFGTGFYAAARQLIERQCGDANLAPERVAAALGCSRASLYRVFARQSQSVGAVIWTARLERARRLLGSAAGVGVPIAEVAIRCGFRETPTFSRMFRRRYGLTPSDARAENLGG
ncbi:MAG: helix-turn-helix transcriptional regulator [Proteobacteria bacterium]|nr:helix-turn-helix transcriptional regulator [Pseudomonadota bacterium]